MIRLKVTGDDGSKLAERAMAEMRVGAPAKMTAAVQVLVKTAQSLVSRPGGAGTASAPGEPPLYVSGELSRSIKGRKIKVWKKGWRRRLTWGSKLAQAASIEYGSSRMAARPFLRPAETLARAEVDRILSEI